MNRNAISLLEKNINRIHWNLLCEIPSLFYMLEKHWNEIDEDSWDDDDLCEFQDYGYENHIHLIEKEEDIFGLDYINWSIISSNPEAISFLEKHQDRIHWSSLSSNNKAIFILEKNVDKIDWSKLSGNCNAISLLMANENKIDWNQLSSNKNPDILSLLEKNKNKICFYNLSYNPNIFTWDYEYYKKRMDIHREELMKKVFHPTRLYRYLEVDRDLFENL